MSAAHASATEPVATIRASRRTGHAVVIVTRGARTRRYIVSLKRYQALREWTAFGRHKWRRSGACLRHGLRVYLWPRADGHQRSLENPALRSE